jgi:phenylpyruvate tautomerase PptA (4-oxalocrotonate tautomerase family)
MDEDQVQSEEKDQVIKDIQDQLKEDHHVIAHSFHDNREMKRKLAKRVSDMETSQDAIGLKRESISKVPEDSKGKEIKQS